MGHSPKTQAGALDTGKPSTEMGLFPANKPTFLEGERQRAHEESIGWGEEPGIGSLEYLNEPKILPEL